MLTKEQLYFQREIPKWSDISLALYKEFTIDCLLPKVFKYYLESGLIIDVVFKEWAMKHLWAIQHIDSHIDKKELFNKIDNGLCIADFWQDRVKRKRLNDNKDRIRAFACVYQVLKTGNMFYIKNGQLEDSKIRIDYIKSEQISKKGINLGMRLEEGVYVPLTLLIDRAINPQKTVEGLETVAVKKLEIIESNKVIETVSYSKI